MASNHNKLKISENVIKTDRVSENMQVTDDKDGEIDVDKITATYEKVVSSENTNTHETSGNARVTLENGQESTEN